MDTWIETANRLWSAILDKVKALNTEGETLQAIANRVGAGSRQNVSAWLSGQRKGVGLAFPDLMSYAERLGIDYRHYFPGGEPPAQELPDCAACKKLLAKDRENQKLQREVERLRQELAEEKTRSKTLDGVIDKLVTNANSGQAGRQKPGPAESKIAG